AGSCDVPEPVAVAADRLDPVGRALAELAADGGYVRVDRAVRREGVRAADPLEELGARVDAPGVRGEEPEHVELRRRERDDRLGDAHLAPRRVDLDRP